MPAIDLAQYGYSAVGQVRIRASAIDPFAGLRGHAYIAARQLNAPVPRLEHNSDGAMTAVLNIQAAARRRRRQDLIASAPVWNMADDASLERLHALIDLAEIEA